MDNNFKGKDVTPKDPNWYKKFDGLQLTEQTQKMISPTSEYNKSESIQHLMQTQERVVAEAKKTGDISKIKDADAFAARLQKEINFHRYSK